MIVTIDPGKLSIAIAVWDRDMLAACSFLKFQNFTELISHVHAHMYYICSLLVIERPQVYVNSRRDIDANDLIDLAKTVGVCHLLAPEVIEVKPAEWKGQVPKRIYQKRILEALTKKELDRVGKLVNNHNVLDAIGIGLKYFKRI